MLLLPRPGRSYVCVLITVIARTQKTCQELDSCLSTVVSGVHQNLSRPDAMSG